MVVYAISEKPDGVELVGQQVIDFTEAFLVSAQTASITGTESVIDGGTVPTV